MIKGFKENFIAQKNEVNGVNCHTGAFSAGLDVLEQAEMDEAMAKGFWVDYFDASNIDGVYPKPFVCAIGFCPAGGTILNPLCGLDIMAQEPKHRIGMHEFKLSMQVPELMLDIWCYTLGEQRFQALQNATLFSAEEALALNIVQEIAPATRPGTRKSPHEKCLKVYAPVFIESKRLARKQLLALVNRDNKN